MAALGCLLVPCKDFLCKYQTNNTASCTVNCNRLSKKAVLHPHHFWISGVSCLQ